MTGSAVHKTVTLGPEWDNAVRQTVARALKHIGAEVTGDSWGVGGSQVLETLDVVIGDRTIRIEAETYMGLSLTGPADLVDRIADMVAKSIGPRSRDPEISHET